MIEMIMSIIRLTVIVLVIFNLPAAFALIDAEHFNRGQYFISHRSRVMLRALVYAGMVAAFPTAGVLGILWFLITFDTALNNRRKDGNFEWDYVGTTADTDKFFVKHKWAWYTYKAIALVAFIIITVKLFF